MAFKKPSEYSLSSVSDWHGTDERLTVTAHEDGDEICGLHINVDADDLDEIIADIAGPDAKPPGAPHDLVVRANGLVIAVISRWPGRRNVVTRVDPQAKARLGA